MRIRKHAMPAMALVMTLPLSAYSASTHAADAVKPVSSAPAKPSPQNQAMRHFSAAGQSAMLDISDARFDIFNGEERTAIKLMASAKTFLGRAEMDAPVFDITSKELVGGKAVETTTESRKEKLVPYGGELALADDFVMTPEKQAHINKANEHFKKGERAKGLEELRLGAIDVTYTRLWIPILSGERHLDQAIKLANDGRYYEANLALKAIEDSKTVDSVTLSDLQNGAAD